MSTPFYDLASLVVVPSGYKASKVYAQKPLTTDGQLTFSRASTATRVNSAGLIETVSSNVPRLDYLGSTCPKLQLEPQRSNVLTYSSEFDNAAWTKVRSTITANGSTSPDGYANADLLVAEASSNDHFTLRSATASIAQSFSVFAKAGGYNYVFVGADNVTTSGVFFNLTNGTISQNTSTLTAKIEDYGNGWYRCSVSSASWPAAFALIATSANGTALIHTGNGTSGVYIWGAQLEAGAYSTSYIPTTTAAVTRLADACSKTGISSLIGQTEGTLFLDIKPFDVGPNVAVRLSDGTNNNRVTFEWSGAKTPVFVVGSSGTLQVYAPVTCALGVRHKIAMAYKANDFRIYIDGVLAASDTSGVVPLNLSELRFGEVPTFDFNGEVNQTLLFKTRLTNAQLAELTTL